MANFVQIQELNRALEDKVDIDMLHDINTSKASVVEMNALKSLIDRVAYEVENKPSFRDIDNLGDNLKVQHESLQKELTLKASIKDLSVLLDQKVNVGDMN